MTRSPVLMALLVGLGLLVTLLSPAVAANLLANGDFERSDEEGGAANWFIPHWGKDPNAEAERVGRGYQSPYCLLLTGKSEPILFGVFSPPVEIAELPTRGLLFTCYYRTREQPQAQISLMTFAEDFRQDEWQTPAVQAEAQNIPQSKGWNLLSWYFEAVPGARQIVVMVRIHGTGQLYIDKAALRPYPDELSAQVQAVGMLDQLPNMCLTTLHLTNRTERERKLRAVLVAVDEKGRATRPPHRDVTIDPRGEGQLALPYRFALGQPHNVQIIVSDPDTGDIYEHQQVRSPGLIEAHFRYPAFRGIILDDIPISHVEIAGRINAAEDLAPRVRLSAQIADLELVATEDNGAITRPTPDSFVIKLPLDKMLTGDYTVSIRAEFEDPRLHQTLQLPLRRLPPSPSQVGYDSRNRLWIGGSPILPRGLYHVAEPEDLAPIAAAGFNFVVVPARRASSALAEQAEKVGLSLVVASLSLGSAGEPGSTGGLWQNLHRKFGNSPSLLGWYVVPRPDQQTLPPALMQQLHEDLQQISPAHLTIMALSSPSLLGSYSDFADIIAAWSLPIPDTPITAVAQMVGAARRAVQGRKPVWAVIQASGPGWYGDARLDVHARGRAPTTAELRAMTYLALMHGANGLIFYGYQIPAYPNTKAFHLVKDAPELWEELATVNRELQWLAPVVLGGQRMLLPPAADGALELATWQYEGGLYVVAVNTSDRGLVSQFQVPDAAGNSLQALFENRSLPTAADGTFQDSFAPYEVHIYTAR